MSELKASGLTKIYPKFTLGPLDLTLQRGITALLGANGAGKSTLMRLIVGGDTPDGGEVTLLTSAASRSGRRVADHVGYLPQDFQPPQRLRVRDFLSYVAWCRRSDDGRGIEEALERVGLIDRAGARCGELSGGMQRRLGVATALIGHHEVLVLDEPSVGLDPVQRTELRDLLRNLAGDRVLLVSTHLSEDVAAIADNVVILDAGASLFQGTPAALVGHTSPRSVTGSAIETAFISVIDAAAAR